MGDVVLAAAEMRQTLLLCDNLYESPDCLYETACCHAALASLAGRPDSGVSAVEGQKVADEAMNWLKRAVAKGYRNREQIRIESAFDSVRKREDFNALFTETEPKSPAKQEQKP